MGKRIHDNINQENLTAILNLLGERLYLVFPGQSWAFVVCGGTALNALKLADRTTKDVDIIGKLEKNIIDYANLSPGFLDQVKLVADTFHLPYNWLNTGPESYIKTGLPSGLLDRLTWKDYGKTLHIGYISRIDQIFFKLYAAVDRGGYHVDDLHRLKPSEEELLSACHWVLQQDPSDEFRILLISMLKQINDETVDGKI